MLTELTKLKRIKQHIKIRKPLYNKGFQGY